MLPMDSWNTYKNYLGLKLHFSSETYDFDKYQGKTSAKKENFLKRNDKFFFQKIGNKYKDETINFLVANLIQDPKKWIGDFNEQDYLEWKKTQQSLSYIFRNDMENLILDESIDCNNFDSIFECNSGQHPLLFKKYLGNKLRLETMVILNKIFNYIDQFDRDIIEEYIWTEKRNLIIKYCTFVSIDIQKCKILLRNML
jgi:hypothetical protein